mgnify:CR=1 FL=1
MAKKVVATLRQGKVSMAKLIKMVKSPKTGAYTFTEQIVTDEQLKDYNEIKKFSFPMYPDPKREVYSKFADITIPRAYLFGKDGKLIHASKGFEEGDMEKVMKMIEKAL